MNTKKIAPAAKAVAGVIQRRDNLFYLMEINASYLLYNIHVFLHALQKYVLFAIHASSWLCFLFFPLFPGFYHRDEDEGCRHQQGDYCRPIHTLGASQHDVAEGQPEQDDADAL